jgi:hypothetical protein
LRLPEFGDLRRGGELCVASSGVGVFVDLERAAPARVEDCHLDYYGHMNNARYLDLASAALPRGFEPRRVRAEYRKAALPGDRIVPWTGAAGEGSLVCALKPEDGGIFTALEFRGVAENLEGSEPGGRPPARAMRQRGAL